ncbi:MAG: RNB domain-containing ribonuclease [Nocardioides sp.]|uniref:RNB domain-containing ribonuclease n=1 Tax=Nocardioides sp. TaxID=35761 RepID=UPI0039E53B42
MVASRVLRVGRADDGVAGQSLRAGIAQIQRELDVTPEFPAEVERAAAAAAGAGADEGLTGERVDRTDLPLVTVDPPGSMDLDQALHLARDGDGYLVHYAIADVAAFVAPGGPVDAEAHRRGETLYGADSKIPLHPTALSEDAASLLPDRTRPALLWTLALDATGELVDTRVERATVRSIARLDYAGVQRMVDAGRFDGAYADSLALFETIGELRLAKEAERGGVDLPLPDQEIEVAGDRWSLSYRRMLPVERWNAQLSLLTGFGAATLMTRAKVGVLRTLPDPDPRDIARLHRTAVALGIAWPDDQPYPAFIRSLDPARADHAAMASACTRLLRGSGYAAFDGSLPALTRHSALAAEYAHVTAPLRRLVDRYAGEVCVALCAGVSVPTWVTDAFATLPETMSASGRQAGAYERAVVNLVEAGVLAPRVGERFSGAIVEVAEKEPTRGSVTVQEPAVEAAVRGAKPLDLGTEVEVTLVTADVASRTVAFELR